MAVYDILFSDLRNNLRVRRFKEDSKLQAAAVEHFDGKTSDYFHKRIELKGTISTYNLVEEIYLVQQRRRRN